MPHQIIDRIRCSPRPWRLYHLPVEQWLPLETILAQHQARHVVICCPDVIDVPDEHADSLVRAAMGSVGDLVCEGRILIILSDRCIGGELGRLVGCEGVMGVVLASEAAGDVAKACLDQGELLSEFMA